MALKKHKGASSELRASAWLLDQGYEVYRNVSQHGLADIVAVNYETGEVAYIDVKTCTVGVNRGLNNLKLTDEQKKKPIKIVAVVDDWIGWADSWK